MILDLLFDSTLVGESDEPGDVRSLTRPLWNLAENAADDQGRGQVPVARFVWGKTWNIPGVVASIAERLEFFDETGVPRRSWLRMRFCRINLADEPVTPAPNPIDLEKLLPSEASPKTQAVEVKGGPQADETRQISPTRLDEVAFRAYGNANLWRVLAWFNNVANPLKVKAGTMLGIPELQTSHTTTASTREKS